LHCIRPRRVAACILASGQYRESTKQIQQSKVMFVFAGADAGLANTRGSKTKSPGLRFHCRSLAGFLFSNAQLPKRENFQQFPRNPISKRGALKTSDLYVQAARDCSGLLVKMEKLFHYQERLPRVVLRRVWRIALRVFP
jgi:hypothetical protein